MAQTYTGSCHCGRVRFEVTTALEGAITCNCSMCSRTGAILVAVPGDQLRLLSGEEGLSDYQFNTMRIHHHFCPNCGIRPFSRGKNREGAPMWMVNARCLDGVDLDALSIRRVDGRSF